MKKPKLVMIRKDQKMLDLSTTETMLIWTWRMTMTLTLWTMMTIFEDETLIKNYKSLKLQKK